MDEAARLLTLVALAGAALTLIGAAFAWFLDERRSLGRTLTQALGAAPDPLLVARGRGVGVGFNLTTDLVAVAWDKGAWRLGYRLDELMGVELIVDRQVCARAFRGEGRRPLDQFPEPEERVRLRFVFDDPGHPDFDLDLWRPEDDGLRGRMDADEALHEANRWMARMEALLRRPVAVRTLAMAAPTPRVAPQTPSPPAAAANLHDDDPPWNDDEDDDQEIASERTIT